MDKIFGTVTTSTPPATTPISRTKRANDHSNGTPEGEQTSPTNNHYKSIQDHQGAHHANTHHSSVPHYALSTSSSINHSVNHIHSNNDMAISPQNAQQQHHENGNVKIPMSDIAKVDSNSLKTMGTSTNATTAEEKVRVIVRVRPLIPDCDEEDRFAPTSGLDEASSRAAVRNSVGPINTNTCITVMDEHTIKVTPDSTAPQTASQVDKKIESYGGKKENREKKFTMDYIFDQESSQENIYEVVYPYVVAAVEGYNSTIMAYGPQSGGKTFTMTGSLDHIGIIPRVIDTIFDEVAALKDSTDGQNIVSVELSYVEIYNNGFKNLLQNEMVQFNANGKINGTSGVNNLNPSQSYAQKYGYSVNQLNSLSFDAASKDFGSEDSRDAEFSPVRGISRQPPAGSNMIDNNSSNRNFEKIEIRESPIIGQFLSPEVRVPISCADDAIDLIVKGDTQRSYSQTGRVTSTRGHAIITIFIETKISTVKEKADEQHLVKGQLKLGKIHLVDLASGERVANTSAAGEELSEGLNINKSLLALSDIFHSLWILASQTKKRKSTATEETVSSSARKNAIAATAKASPLKSPSGAAPRTVFSPSNIVTAAVASTPGSSGNLHVPYLHSKLTHYLRDSFGGNGKSMIIVNIPPCEKYYQDNIRVLNVAAMARKAINYPYPVVFDINMNISIDKKTEFAIITLLKQRLQESLMRSPIKKGLKLANLPTQPRAKAYNFFIRNILLTDLPYVSFPMRPWLKLELKGASFRTQKQLSKLQHAYFLEEFTFELDAFDYEDGIEMEIHVFNKIPFRSKVELARIKFRIVDSFPVMVDSKVKVRFPMEPCVPANKTPILYMYGSVRPSLASKVSFFDRSAPVVLQSPRKLPTIVCRQTIRSVAPPQFDPNNCYVLSLKSFTTTDALIITSDNASDTVGGYKFGLEAKFGPDKRRSATISGRARYRGKDKIATVFFDEPDLKFKTLGSQIKAESIYLILFVKGSDVSSQVIGRVIQPVAELLDVQSSDDVSTKEYQAQLKDVTGKVTGRVTFCLKLHLTSLLKEDHDYLDENFHVQRNLKIIPSTMNQGWIRITSVEGIRMNTLKLLGLHAKHCDNSCDDDLRSVVKQDLLLVMEYGEHWVATSQLKQDQEDTCSWTDLDFKIFAEREDLLKQSLKISVFNRKIEGKEGLIGSCAVALHQILDNDLAINKAPVYIKTRRGKPNGRLLISGILVKDNGDSWMVAQIAKVRHDGHFDIRYEDGEIEHKVSKDLLLLYNHDPRSRHQSFKVNRSKFQVGISVEVQFGAKDLWYPAVIAADHGNQHYDIDTTYDIPKTNIPQNYIRFKNFNDGMGSNASVAGSITTNITNISPTNTMTVGASSIGGHSRSHVLHPTLDGGYKVGDKVEANFKSKGKWYLATVYERFQCEDGSMRYDIDYVSGVREFKVAEDKLRPKFSTKYVHGTKIHHGPGTASKSRDNANLPLDPTGMTINVKQSQSTIRPHSSSFTNLTSLLSSTTTDDHSLASSYDPIIATSSQFEQRFVAGERVLANYHERGSYLPGTVEEIDEHGLLTILYENGDSDVNVDPDSVRRFSDKDDEATGTIGSGTLTDTGRIPFKLNDRVEGNFRGIGKWLPAHISKSRGGGVFDLVYDDGRIETKVSADCVRIYDPDLYAGFKFDLGEEVEVNSKGLGYWYPCKIAKQRVDGAYDIIFDDNETESHVPEKFLRLPRRDKDIIPRVKPVFEAGDKVLVKSRSRAVEQEIKNFQENRLKSEKQLKELFKSLRQVEMEQGMLTLSKQRCKAEMEESKPFKKDVLRFVKSGMKGLSDEAVAEALTTFSKMEEEENSITNQAPVIEQLEERIKDMHGELTKKLLRISQLEKKLSLVCTHIALSSRSGLEEAEMHSISSGTTDLSTQCEEIELSKEKCQQIIDLHIQARKELDSKIVNLVRYNKYMRTLADAFEKSQGDSSLLNTSEPSITPFVKSNIHKPGSGNNLAKLNRFHPSLYSPASVSSTVIDNDPVYADDDVGYDVYCNDQDEDFSELDHETNVSTKMMSHPDLMLPKEEDSSNKFQPSFMNEKKTALGTLLLGSKIAGYEEYDNWKQHRHSSSDDQLDDDFGNENCSPGIDVRRTNKCFKKVFNRRSLVSVGLVRKIRVSSIIQSGATTKPFLNADCSTKVSITFPTLEVPSKAERLVSPVTSTSESNKSKTEDPRIIDAKRSLEEKRLRSDLAELSFRKVISCGKPKEICEAMQQCINKFVSDFHLKHVVESRGNGDIDRHRQTSEQEKKYAELCEAKRVEAVKLAESAREIALEKHEDVFDNKRPDSPLSNSERTGAEDRRYTVESAEEYIMLLEAAKRASVEEWSRWKEAALLATEEIQAYQRWSHTLKRRLKDLKNLAIRITESIEEYKVIYKARVDTADVINELKLKVDVKRKELSALKDSIERESLAYDRLLKKANEASLTSKIIVRQSSMRDMKRTSSNRNNSVAYGLSPLNMNTLPIIESGDAFGNDTDGPLMLESTSTKEQTTPFAPTTPVGAIRRKSVFTTAVSSSDILSTAPRSGRRQSMSSVPSAMLNANMMPATSRRQVDDPHDKAVEIHQKRLAAENDMKNAQNTGEELFREIRRAENFWIKNEKEAFMIATTEDSICPASSQDLTSYSALNGAKANITKATELRKELQEYLEDELRLMTEVIEYCELEKKFYSDAITQIVSDSEVLANIQRIIEVEVGHESSKKKLEKERLELLEIKEKVQMIEKEINSHQRLLQSTFGSHAQSSMNTSANSVIAEEQAKRLECIDQALKFQQLSIEKEAQIDDEAIERIGKDFYALNASDTTGNALKDREVSAFGYMQLDEVQALFDKESHDIGDAIRLRTEQHKAFEAAMQHIRREQDLMQFGKLDQSHSAFQKIQKEFQDCLTALETDNLLVDSQVKEYKLKKEEVSDELSTATSQMQSYNHFLAKVPEGMQYLNSSDYNRLKKAFDGLIKKIKHIHSAQREAHENYQGTFTTRQVLHNMLSDNVSKIKAKFEEADKEYAQHLATKDKYSDTVTILTESKEWAAIEIPKFAVILEHIGNEKKYIQQEMKLLDDELQYINAAKLYLDEVRHRVEIEKARSACRTGLGRIMAGSHGFIPKNLATAEGLKWRKRLHQLKKQHQCFGPDGMDALPWMNKITQEKKVMMVKSFETQSSQTFANAMTVQQGNVSSYLIFDQKECAPDEIFDPRSLSEKIARKVNGLPHVNLMYGVAGRARAQPNPRYGTPATIGSPVVPERPVPAAVRAQNRTTMTPPASMPSFENTIQGDSTTRLRRTLSAFSQSPRVINPTPVRPESLRSLSVSSAKLDLSSLDSCDSGSELSPTTTVATPTSTPVVVNSRIEELERKILFAKKVETELTKEAHLVKEKILEWNGRFRAEPSEVERHCREAVMSEEELQEEIRKIRNTNTVGSVSNEEKEHDREKEDDDNVSIASSMSASPSATNATASSVHNSSVGSPAPHVANMVGKFSNASSRSANPSPLSVNLPFVAR